MVKSVSGLTGSGVKDFLIQRLTAYVLLAYIGMLIFYAYSYAPLDYAAWKALWSLSSVKIGTLVSCVSLIAHAWIGMWTVFTDYIHCAKLRGILMVGMFLVYLADMIWVIQILWS